MEIGVTLSGDKELVAKLNRLPGRVYDRVVRKATAKAMTPVSKAARSKAPKETGALRRSMGKRTKAYRRSGVVVTLVGPRVGFEMDGRKPANYAHLVELGHLTQEGGFVPPHPFMRPALDSQKANVFGTMRRELHRGIEREAKRA